MVRRADSIELAQRTAHGAIDPEALAWLVEGFAAWLSGQPLDDALGLDAPARLRARNRALREASYLLDAHAGPWARAGLLAAAIARFEARILPQLRRDPTRQLGPVDRALQRAFASGYTLPRTQRGLFPVLSD